MKMPPLEPKAAAAEVSALLRVLKEQRNEALDREAQAKASVTALRIAQVKDTQAIEALGKRVAELEAEIAKRDEAATEPAKVVYGEGAELPADKPADEATLQ